MIAAQQCKNSEDDNEIPTSIDIYLNSKQPAIFSKSNKAIHQQIKLKNWTPITLSQAKACNLEDDLKRPIRIYSDGVFDLFHNGHAEHLRQAKNVFPNTYLIVGVCSDEDVVRYKGSPSVMTVNERCETVRHCRYVDEVYESPPFYPTMEFVNRIKCDLVTHDALPYVSPYSTDCYEIFKKTNRFFATERTPFVSTTDLLKRIMNNIEIFQNRNQTRLVAEQNFLNKGYS